MKLKITLILSLLFAIPPSFAGVTEFKLNCVNHRDINHKSNLFIVGSKGHFDINYAMISGIDEHDQYRLQGLRYYTNSNGKVIKNLIVLNGKLTGSDPGGSNTYDKFLNAILNVEQKEVRLSTASILTASNELYTAFKRNYQNCTLSN
ncbi:hypothetical protein [Vibrio cyclitrophicus]|uniref:hypothetical protein n=1 Tax=Vibrio cyclitrophicus TaxID=47951 RepID=UPI00037251C9|nr:hypothetical protein [Vibrio cyclitrophicus]OEF29012.1 hypothetical protein OA9_10495 [Vibrio cyclitrophicus 1F97]